MKKVILVALAMLVAAFGGWYFASPSYALMSLHDAVKAGDADAMEDHIDFPAVRESVKMTIKEKMAEQVSAPDADPLAALGMAMADKLLDPMIDGMLTPNGVAKLIEHGGALSAVSGDGKDTAKVDTNDSQQTPNYQIEREGLSEFTVSFPDDEKTPQLVFQRHGLSWKLSAIDVSKLELPGQ